MTEPLARHLRHVETIRVERQNQRARAYGTAALLTVDEWLDTLKHFQWACAYCGAPYDVLEHVEPVEVDGTRKRNCVPACRGCNALKRNQWILEWIHDDRIQAKAVIDFWYDCLKEDQWNELDEETRAWLTAPPPPA